MKCAVYLIAETKRSAIPLSFQAWVQCHTSATSLRKQNSKLRVSDPRCGAAHRTCAAANRARDGESGGHPAPHV